MSRACDKSATLNIEMSERSAATTALLKVHFDRHCEGKNGTGVNPGYVKKLFKSYEYAVIATTGNHMGTRSKKVKNLCGFLFIRKRRKGAYIDLVCSSEKIGWMLLDFAEDFVHNEWKIDGVYLHALDSVRCMYASRGYREVDVETSCKRTVTSEPKRLSSTGTRMSKCVAKGKKISTDKLHPPECDSKKNRQFYPTNFDTVSNGLGFKPRDFFSKSGRPLKPMSIEQQKAKLRKMIEKMKLMMKRE